MFIWKSFGLKINQIAKLVVWVSRRRFIDYSIFTVCISILFVRPAKQCVLIETRIMRWIAVASDSIDNIFSRFVSRSRAGVKRGWFLLFFYSLKFRPRPQEERDNFSVALRSGHIISFEVLKCIALSWSNGDAIIKSDNNNNDYSSKQVNSQKHKTRDEMFELKKINNHHPSRRLF